MRFKCYQKDPPTKGRKVLSMYDWKNWYRYSQLHGLPRWLSGKESTCQCRRPRFHPWVRKIPWRRKWLPSLVFLPGKFHGKRERGELQFTGSQRIVRNSAHTFSALVGSQGNSPTPLWGLSVAGSTHPQSTRAAGSLLPCYSTQSLFGDLTFKVIQQCRTRTSSHPC